MLRAGLLFCVVGSLIGLFLVGDGAVQAAEVNADARTAATSAFPRAALFTPDPASVVRHGPAFKYPQHGWLVVHIEGAPYERGVQHGRLLAEEIVDYQKTIALHRSTHDPAAGWRDLRTLSDALVLRTYKDEYLEEMRGIADGAAAAGARVDGRRIDLVDIVALNSFIELEFLARALEATPTGLEGRRFETPPVAEVAAPADDHCSAFAASGSATGGGLVFGHITMFSLPVVRHFNVWLDVAPTDGHRLVMQGYPGCIQSGLDYYVNGAGILITETTIAQTTFNAKGSSVVSRIREAAQYADSIDEAIELLEGANNGLYTNEWILADVKTGETAMFELGTGKSKLWRSTRDEWPGNTSGFYWGCNNAKDPALRLETLAGVNDKPADVLYFPKDRDQAWLRLYEQHKGRMTTEFGFTAFGVAPIVGYRSCDAKFTDVAMATRLESWALFGPPLGRTWVANKADLAKDPHVRPLVANDWTVIGTAAPTAVGKDAPTAAVDLAPFRKDEPGPKVHVGSKLPPAWRGTLLPASDADLWLSVAFAEYEKFVALQKALTFEATTDRDAKVDHAKEKKLGRRAQDAIDTALFKKRSDWLTAVRRLDNDVPLSKLHRSWSDQNWHRIALGKGTMYLDALRGEIGPERFDRLMDDFGTAHAGREVSTDEFFNFLTESGVADVRRSANRWLDGRVEDDLLQANPWAVDSFEDEPTEALIVYGTLADKAAQRESAELLQKNIAARWCNVIVPAKADADVTDEELKSRHILLIGRPATNAVAGRFADKMSVQFGPASFALGGESYAHPGSAILFACENPMTPRYSLVVYAGLSADATWHAVQAFPDCGGRGSEAILLAHGAKPRPMVVGK